MNYKYGGLLAAAFMVCSLANAAESKIIKTVTMGSFDEGYKSIALHEVHGECIYFANVSVTKKKNEVLGFEMSPSLFFTFDVVSKKCRDEITPVSMSVVKVEGDVFTRLPIKVGSVIYLSPNSNLQASKEAGNEQR